VIFPQVFEQESEKLGAEKAQVTPSFLTPYPLLLLLLGSA
jgi:hypothetical protein